MDDDEHDDRDLFVYVYLFVYVLLNRFPMAFIHRSNEGFDRWGEFRAYLRCTTTNCNSTIEPSMHSPPGNYHYYPTQQPWCQAFPTRVVENYAQTAIRNSSSSIKAVDVRLPTWAGDLE